MGLSPNQSVYIFTTIKINEDVSYVSLMIMVFESILKVTNMTWFLSRKLQTLYVCVCVGVGEGVGVCVCVVCVSVWVFVCVWCVCVCVCGVC